MYSSRQGGMRCMTKCTLCFERGCWKSLLLLVWFSFSSICSWCVHPPHWLSLVWSWHLWFRLHFILSQQSKSVLHWNTINDNSIIWYSLIRRFKTKKKTFLTCTNNNWEFDFQKLIYQLFFLYLAGNKYYTWCPTKIGSPRKA